MSASRLQKLLKLLESNNDSTRKAASKQICEIAKAHPSQLVSITRKVHTLLYSSSWDTRVVAAATIGGLADAFPHHSVHDLAAAGTSVCRQQQQTVYHVDVQLASINLNKVLSKGEPLLASGGQEYDSVDNSLPLNERVAKQRQMLRERLGLGKGLEGKAFEDIVNTDELVDEDDLAAAFTASTRRANSGSGRGSKGSGGGSGRQRSATPEKQAAADVLRSDSMSARERNKLKRKYKALTRQDSCKAEGKGRGGGLNAAAAGREDSPSSPMTKPCGPLSQHATAAAAAAAAAAGAAAGGGLSDEQAAEQDEAEWHVIECGGWPFQRLADQLCNDILSPVWVVRHGAAAGLRELLQRQAAAAAVEAPLLDNTSGWASPGGEGLRHLGVVPPEALESAAAANAAWLEDMIEHLLCVLALDRFADYLSDQVVVPVRETAAQALGAILQPTSVSTLHRVLQLLASMHQHQEWSVRHGAFTGIKYLLASRPEAAEVLLPAALPVLLAGLTDKDDSVQAAAAEALVPVAPLLLSLGDQQVIITKLRTILWKCLSLMEEELSVATSSSLSLLAALYSPPAHITADTALASRLPVLWPFLLHNMTSVRMAAATSLERLASAGFDLDPAQAAALGTTVDLLTAQGAWLKSVAGPCLRLLLQCLVVERDARVQQGLLRAWSSLLEQAQAADVASGVSLHDLRAMLSLVSTPCGHALDASQLVIPCQGRLVAWGSADAEEAGYCARPAKKLKVKPEPGNGCSSSHDLSGVSNQGGAAAGALSLDPEAWPGMEDQEPAVRTRLLACRALAQLCCKLQGQEPPVLAGLLYQHLQQLAASSRIAAALVILNWLQLVATSCREAAAAAALEPHPDKQVAVDPFTLTTVALSAVVCEKVPEALPDTCLAYLGAPGASMPSAPAADPYSEVAPLYARMRKDLYALVNASLQVGAVLTSPSGVPLELVSPEGAIAMAAAVPAEADVGDVAQAKLSVLQSATHVQLMEAYLHTSACLVLASTVVASGRLPTKLNSIIQNLMAGLRKEPAIALQEVAAAALAELMAGVAARQPCPNEKLVKNVCTMVCGDARETPSAAAAEGLSVDEDVPSARLFSQTAANATAGAAHTTAAAAPLPQSVGECAAATARVGGECALRAVCERFGGGLFLQLPSLWLQMSAALGADTAGKEGAPSGEPQGLINAMQVVKAVVPALHSSLVPQGLQLLPQLCACLRHANAAVRLAAARCLAALAAAQAEAVLSPLLKQIVPLLAGTNTVECRLGAVELMAHLVSQLQRQLIPYTVLLVVPLLRRMSDPVAAVRRKAALCFGSLTALLPLAQGLPLPAGLDAEQRACAEQDGEFLSQLLDNRKVEDYSLPVKLKVELRRYQQEGINWLSFLRRFGLSGVLADDMGLGKTLQATTIMACSAAEHQAAAASGQQEQLQQQDDQPADEGSKQAAAVAVAEQRPGCGMMMPSLVVCPSTLVGHWAHEVNKYVDESVLKPLAITGGPSERAAAARHLQDGKCNVIIISYEALRSDAEWAAGVEWDYVILDEGHVIRSTKSKLAQAVKRLSAQHRLVLSGTPIQNSALELWSLFDFLMPGFLGGEREFNARYGRVVNAAKYSKKGSKEAEAGTLALDALHKQVMPFILRRTKAQVLQDLPPKIVTDVLCRLSAIQQQLYEDFSASQALTEVTGALKQQQQESAGDSGGGGRAAAASSTGERHVFSALLYLRKLCSHPLLALDWSVSAHKEACQRVLGASTQQAAEAALRSLEHAPKLLALQDILVQCGLVNPDQMGPSSLKSSGNCGTAELALTAGTHDSGHRLLVFAQLKGMLDLVDSCLLKPLGISSLRLDGSIDASARFGIVQRFNTDPTIQVLLLTTHVGGLGLNLTSADTVVFLEHDWNPMKDLQAMDRAHRIGQTRTVNVYRLLMQDTLEERIMSLQQFKLDVANAVVNQDNMSMSAMDTGQLLDLFAGPTAATETQQQQQHQQPAAASGAGAADTQAAAGGTEIATAGRKKSVLQTMLDSMGDLWDESQYQSEFDMKGFMQKLAKQQPQQQQLR